MDESAYDRGPPPSIQRGGRASHRHRKHGENRPSGPSHTLSPNVDPSWPADRGCDPFVMKSRAITGLGLLFAFLLCACSGGSPGGGGKSGPTGDGGSSSGSGGGSGGGGAGTACFRITDTDGMQQCGYQSVNSPGFTCAGIEPVNTYSAVRALPRSCRAAASTRRRPHTPWSSALAIT